MQISEKEVRKCLQVLLTEKKAETSSMYASACSSKISSSEIKRLKEQLKRIPSTRSRRVSQVKRAIRGENYGVPSRQVAAKIIGRAISDKIR